MNTKKQLILDHTEDIIFCAMLLCSAVTYIVHACCSPSSPIDLNAIVTWILISITVSSLVAFGLIASLKVGQRWYITLPVFFVGWVFGSGTIPLAVLMGGLGIFIDPALIPFGLSYFGITILFIIKTIRLGVKSLRHKAIDCGNSRLRFSQFYELYFIFLAYSFGVLGYCFWYLYGHFYFTAAPLVALLGILLLVLPHKKRLLVNLACPLMLADFVCFLILFITIYDGLPHYWGYLVIPGVSFVVVLIFYIIYLVRHKKSSLKTNNF